MTEQSTAAATQTTDAAAANAESTTAATLVTDNAATTGTTTQTTSTDTAQANSGKADEVKAENVSKAPEKYEFKAPEGLNVDTAVQGEFEGIARELGLDQAGADKLYALGAKMAQAHQQAFETALTQQSEQWAEAAKTDKEIGGDKFDASVASARQALAKYATPELRTLLEQTRLGNHPEVLRLFHRIGSTIADDKLVSAPSAGGSERKSAASVLFDHPSSNPQR